jgi:DNA-binding CsgD family transcriptional regulator
MLCAHLSSGHRIRRAVVAERATSRGSSSLPHGAEAVLDPKTFCITDAIGKGKEKEALEWLRDAAVRVDRARGRLRTKDPAESLKTWWALMRGRWSMIDWFDADDRRFVLAIPNSPALGDPRGLTERELQVATYAALGESGKRISYRLGLSKSTVSNALDAAMHKLSVKTQPQLAEKMRGIAQELRE